MPIEDVHPEARPRDARGTGIQERRVASATRLTQQVILFTAELTHTMYDLRLHRNGTLRSVLTTVMEFVGLDL